MRIARVVARGAEHYAVLDGERVRLLAGPPFEGIVETGATAALSEVKLLAPTHPVNYWGWAAGPSRSARTLEDRLRLHAERRMPVRG